MFEHFTFGAQAQPTFDLEDNTSPTDISFPPITPAPTSYFQSTSTGHPRTGLHEIMDKFSQHTLQQFPADEPHASLWNVGLPSPDLEMDESMGDELGDDFTPEEMSYVSTTRGLTSVPLPPPRSGLACRRLQRQLNVQLQSCNKHVRDISTLVEDMISTSSQCRLHASSSRPNLHALASPPPSGLVPGKSQVELPFDTVEPFEGRAISPDEDEGFAEMDDPDGLLALEDEMSLRRASTPIGIRKYNVVRWRKSAESVGAPMVARTKVRSMPRMRRRKAEPVVE